MKRSKMILIEALYIIHIVILINMPVFLSSGLTQSNSHELFSLSLCSAEHELFPVLLSNKIPTHI
jgi:hypothetical protein